MLPQGIDPRRWLDLDAVAGVAAGQAARHHPAGAAEGAGCDPRSTVIADVRIGDRCVEADFWGYFPAEIAADGPSIALQPPLQRVRAIVEGLVTAEHADQEIRCELARQSCEQIDMVAIEQVCGRRRARTAPAIERC